MSLQGEEKGETEERKEGKRKKWEGMKRRREEQKKRKRKWRTAKQTNTKSPCSAHFFNTYLFLSKLETNLAISWQPIKIPGKLLSDPPVKNKFPVRLRGASLLSVLEVKRILILFFNSHPYAGGRKQCSRGLACEG